MSEVTDKAKKYEQIMEDEQARGISIPFIVLLLLGSAVLFCAVFFFIWALPIIGVRAFSGGMQRVLFWVAIIASAIVFAFCLSITVCLVWRIKLPGVRILKMGVNFLLLPAMQVLGFFLRIPKRKIRLAFIRINNELVKSSSRPCKPHELLIILPHCVQKSTCKYRLTYSIQNCVRCGGCCVGDILKICDSHAVEAVIVPGGTAARMVIKDKRPRSIIAVACHRDLASGVKDTALLPVYGVLNIRPFGPCIDTTVDTARLEEAIIMFLGKGFKP